MKHVQSDYKLPFNCVVVASPWQQRRNLFIITTLSRYLLQRRNSNRSSDSTSVGSVQVDRIPDVARRARRLRPVPEVGRRHPSERCDVVITWCQCVRCLQPVSSQSNNVPTPSGPPARRLLPLYLWNQPAAGRPLPYVCLIKVSGQQIHSDDSEEKLQKFI